MVNDYSQASKDCPQQQNSKHIKIVQNCGPIDQSSSSNVGKFQQRMQSVEHEGLKTKEGIDLSLKAEESLYQSLQPQDQFEKKKALKVVERAAHSIPRNAKYNLPDSCLSQVDIDTQMTQYRHSKLKNNYSSEGVSDLVAVQEVKKADGKQADGKESAAGTATDMHIVDENNYIKDSRYERKDNQ